MLPIVMKTTDSCIVQQSAHINIYILASDLQTFLASIACNAKLLSENKHIMIWNESIIVSETLNFSKDNSFHYGT